MTTLMDGKSMALASKSVETANVVELQNASKSLLRSSAFIFRCVMMVERFFSWRILPMRSAPSVVCVKNEMNLELNIYAHVEKVMNVYTRLEKQFLCHYIPQAFCIF